MRSVAPHCFVLASLILVGWPRSGTARESQSDSTALTLLKVDERVQIYVLRKRAPPPSLKVVFAPEPVPTDAWGRPLHFVTPGPGGQPWDIVSYGEDGTPGATSDVW